MSLVDLPCLSYACEVLDPWGFTVGTQTLVLSWISKYLNFVCGSSGRAADPVIEGRGCRRRPRGWRDCRCRGSSSPPESIQETGLFPELPRWLSGKEPACDAGDDGDAGSIPGLGRSPGGRHGDALQYSCLENLKDRGAWQAAVCGVASQSDDRVTEHSTLPEGFPGGASGKEPACQCRGGKRRWFSFWVRKIPWRRK